MYCTLYCHSPYIILHVNHSPYITRDAKCTYSASVCNCFVVLSNSLFHVVHWRVMPGKLYIIDALSMEIYCMQETAVRETKGVLERGSTAHTVNGRKQQYYPWYNNLQEFSGGNLKSPDHQRRLYNTCTHNFTAALRALSMHKHRQNEPWYVSSFSKDMRTMLTW